MTAIDSIGQHRSQSGTFKFVTDFESTRDLVLLSLWFLVTFKQFNYDELILYPLALYFGWAFIRDFPLLFPTIMRSLIIFCFPLWWLLSALWGAETGLILKTGSQLVLTMMICVNASQRVDTRKLIVALMFVGTFFALLSLQVGITGSGIIERGVFKSKNAMGLAMVLLWIATLCVLFDRTLPKWLRVLAIFILVLAGRQLWVANSVTALLLSIGMLFTVLLFGVLPQSGVLRKPGFYIGMLFAIGFVLIPMGMILARYDVQPVETVLAGFGKDTTLTGRTELWAYATEQISLRPVLGVGAGGFWTPHDGSSLARRIYEDFYKSLNATFSFHNSYFEIAVHQGLIGLFFAVAQVLWTFSRIMKQAFIKNSMPTAFFVCIAFFTIAQSLTESNLMVAFSLPLMLFTIGALTTIPNQYRPRTNLDETR